MTVKKLRDSLALLGEGYDGFIVDVWLPGGPVLSLTTDVLTDPRKRRVSLEAKPPGVM